MVKEYLDWLIDESSTGSSEDGKVGEAKGVADETPVVVASSSSSSDDVGLFGGGGDVIPTTMSDVHVFEIDKQTWFQPISCDDKARQWPRQWHSATFLPQRQLLICFGGETMNPKTGRVTTSDKNNLMVLDTEILLWYPPSVSGDLPRNGGQQLSNRRKYC